MPAKKSSKKISADANSPRMEWKSQKWFQDEIDSLEAALLEVKTELARMKDLRMKHVCVDGILKPGRAAAIIRDFATNFQTAIRNKSIGKTPRDYPEPEE